MRSDSLTSSSGTDAAGPESSPGGKACTTCESRASLDSVIRVSHCNMHGWCTIGSCE